MLEISRLMLRETWFLTVKIHRGLPSGIGNLVSINAAGDAGNISVTAANLTLTNGGQVSASTLGLGDAGQVNVLIAGDITLDGMNFGHSRHS